VISVHDLDQLRAQADEAIAAGAALTKLEPRVLLELLAVSRRAAVARESSPSDLVMAHQSACEQVILTLEQAPEGPLSAWRRAQADEWRKKRDAAADSLDARLRAAADDRLYAEEQSREVLRVEAQLAAATAERDELRRAAEGS
jgi:hypothetical protein